MKNAGEKAMALVDGQLAPAEVPDLVHELARNAPLVAELQKYLAMSRSRIAAAYAAKSEEPVPGWLIESVMRATTPVPRRTRLSVFGRDLLQWLRGSCRVPAWSLAAAPLLAALLAILSAWLAAPAPGRVSVAAANLEAALERTQSGKDAALVTLRPMLSFNSKNAGWCRQVEVRHASTQVSHALACRGSDGHWNVVASTPPGPTGLMPAGANQRKAIDDLATFMMRHNPLSQADEAATIGRGWRQP